MSVNKRGVKCATLLRFWENKGSINEIDPYCWFQWYFRYISGILLHWGYESTKKDFFNDLTN